MATGIVLVLAIGVLGILFAAFSPGAAMLHFAKRTRWSAVPTVLAVIFVLAPIAIIVASPDSPMKALAKVRSELFYAFWFYPGLIVVLNKYSKKGPRLGIVASLIYLSPYLLLQGFNLVINGFIAGPEISGFVAVLVILTFRSERLLVPARIVGVVLLLVPIAVPLAVYVPKHLAMADTCASRAGSALTAEPRSVDILAMELDKTGCSRECVIVIAAQTVETVESRSSGLAGNRSDYPAGLYRYHLGPLLDRKFSPPYPLEGGGICERRINFNSETRCLQATPIEGYSADYLVRARPDDSPHDALRNQSFEIVDRNSGDVVAWTAAYFLPRNSRSGVYDVPLGLVFERHGRCENNGPDLTEFIYGFLNASR